MDETPVNPTGAFDNIQALTGAESAAGASHAAGASGLATTPPHAIPKLTQ